MADRAGARMCDCGWFVEQWVDFNLAGLWLLYLSVFFAVTSAGEYIGLFVQAVDAKERRLAVESTDP